MRRRIDRPALVGMAAIVAFGVLLGQRSTSPAVADPPAAARLAAEQRADATAAQRALRQLRTALAAALDEGRRGAGLLIGGTDPPGQWLAAAGRDVGAAEALAATARRRLRALEADVTASGTGGAPRLGIAAGELTILGGQLAAVAGDADRFAAMRAATDRTLVALVAAATALRADRSAEARAQLDAASRAIDEVRAWSSLLITLPIWIDTTTRLIAAGRQIATALLARDPLGTEVAGRAYAAAAATAHQADQALGVAIAEGGAGITALPLRRTADALAAVDAALTATATIGDRR